MTKISVAEVGYIAGLFDGEGSLHIRRGMEKKKKHRGKPGYRMSNSMRISMEIAMTDEFVIRWVHEILGVGTVIRRDVKGLTKTGKKFKTQWRWRCTFRDCYYVCKLLWADAKVKLHKIEQVIDHYEPEYIMNEKVVSLHEYRQNMDME
jgi:hypothetical protein|tara:strand:+ start:45 stop:491 length:447 start_codon:yes stop_codon:yes gene_type:complete